MKYCISIFLFIILITSCSVDSNKLVGTYSSENLKVNCDTLILRVDGTYQRKLYVLKTKERIYSQSGSWHFSNGSLTLENFLIDRDRVYIENYNFEESLMECSFDLSINLFGGVSFDYGPYLDGKFVYTKIN